MISGLLDKNFNTITIQGEKNTGPIQAGWYIADSDNLERRYVTRNGKNRKNGVERPTENCLGRYETLSHPKRKGEAFSFMEVISLDRPAASI